MSKYRTGIILLYLMVSVAAVAACVPTTPIAVHSEQAADQNRVPFAQSRNILLLPIDLEYINAANNKKIESKQYKQSTVQQHVTKAISYVWSKKGFNRLNTSHINSIVGGPYQSLSNQIQELFKTIPSVNARRKINNICEKNPGYLITGHQLQVKISGKGRWLLKGTTFGPGGKSVTPNSNTSLLRVVTWDCKTSKAVWKREVFFRRVPAVSSEDYESSKTNLMQAVRILYFDNK